MDWTQQKVREFHRAMGMPAPDVPSLDSVRRELRARLILEEAIETVAALGFRAFVGWRDTFSAEGHTSGPHITLHRAGNPDWPDVIDGLCDLRYVTDGTAVEAGIDLAAFFAEVHRSNMTKAGGPVREDGKVLKPPGYEPPRIAYLLERALARGSE